MLQNGCLHAVLILQGSLKGYFYFALEKTPPDQKKFEKSLLNGVFVLCSAAIGMAGHVVGKGR